MTKDPEFMNNSKLTESLELINRLPRTKGPHETYKSLKLTNRPELTYGPKLILTHSTNDRMLRPSEKPKTGKQSKIADQPEFDKNT